MFQIANGWRFEVYNSVKRVTAQNRKRLAEMRAVKVEFVSLLPANVDGCSCGEAWYRKGKVIPIEEAGDLPLPTCKDRCMCLYVAHLKP